VRSSHHVRADRAQIRRLRRIEHQRVQFGDLEQLPDDAAHALDVGVKLPRSRAVAKGLDAGLQNSQRRSQLMRRIGGELSLHAKAVLEPVERLVDGRDQRKNLAWNLPGRQPDIGSRRADAFCLFRCPQQRGNRATKDDDVGRKQDQQCRNCNPPDAPEEVGDDVVDDDVAMREIFGNLNAQRLAADIFGDACSGDRAGRRSRRGNDRLAILVGGK
jgi:hypothetical protein